MDYSVDFDLNEIRTCISECSGIDTVEIDDHTLNAELIAVIYEVLSFTNRKTLNEPLKVVCKQLTMLNWVKKYYLSEDMNDSLLTGTPLSISEGDTRIAYQNMAQLDGYGATYGAFGFTVDSMYTILKRYRKLPWLSSEDIDG